MKKSEEEFRYFELSSNAFDDIYGTKILLSEVNTVDDIIKIFIKNTEDLFKFHNMEKQLKVFINIKSLLHIHDKTMVDIINAPCDETIYICNHC